MLFMLFMQAYRLGMIHTNPPDIRVLISASNAIQSTEYAVFINVEWFL